MNAPTCHIRPIRMISAADLDAVLAVQAACYPPPMRKAAAVVLARIHAAAETCVVAEDGDGVCAYLFAYPSRIGVVTPLDAHFEPAPGADTLYLHDLSVAPRAHRRGLARALAGRLLALGRARGMQASALVSVQDSAGFWAALGYRAMHLACPLARQALAGYPGGAQYMTRGLAGSVTASLTASLTAPGAPSPNC